MSNPEPSISDYDLEDFVSTLKLLRLYPPGTYRHTVAQEFLQDEFQYGRRDAFHESIRLLELADEGDAAAKARVDPIEPDWKFGSDAPEEGEVCLCCKGIVGRPAKAGKKAADVDEESRKPFVPSAKPGSATALAWRALVDLSPEGEPVDPQSWREAALIALARSERVSDPVSAFRDARRNLREQRAFDEAKDGAIVRKI